MADNINKEQYVEPQVVNTIVASDELLVATVNTVSISEKRYKRELLRYEAALRKSELIPPNIEKHSVVPRTRTNLSSKSKSLTLHWAWGPCAQNTTMHFDLLNHK